MLNESFVYITHEDFPGSLVEITADARPNTFEGVWDEMLLEYGMDLGDPDYKKNLYAIICGSIRSAYMSGYNDGIKWMKSNEH